MTGEIICLWPTREPASVLGLTSKILWLFVSPLNLECSRPRRIFFCLRTPGPRPRYSMRTRDQIIKDSLLSHFLSFKEVTQTTRCLRESRPHGFILISAGTFHYRTCPSPSDENIRRPHLKQCLEQTREKERQEMGKREKNELQGGKNTFQKNYD